ncbi:hypothetical protein PAXY110619_30000 [Paenibacillus xylanexedens]|uniref:Uncharacterized protein n=1 Tax=Paenibacillus xylanexedens TaxID=528191 RepID=A0ABS4RSI4_PAEXY|nr:hypothetical protein [Paenibacillus xylanexedens]
MTLSTVFQTLPKSRTKDIKGSVVVHTSCGLPVKLVFVHNRNKRREWLTILSTDVTLDETKIVRIYVMRGVLRPFLKSPRAI